MDRMFKVSQWFAAKISENEKGDARRVYLLRVASYILGLNIAEEKLRQPQALHAFCDTNVTLLAISRNEKSVELSNVMKSGGNQSRVVFYKSKPVPLTPENYKNIVNIVTMNAAPNEVFLKSVQNVFSKNISDTLKDSSNKHLATVVNELEENLLATIHQDDTQGEGVSSLSDEIRAWKSRSGASAQQFSDAFAPLGILLDTIEDRPLDELSVLLEAFEDTCDALWNSQPQYTENRMKSLILAMGSFLCDQISHKIDAETIWKSNGAPEKLRLGISLCDQWDLSVRLMTGQTWKRQLEDQWKGDEVDMKYLIGYKKRLEEILSLKLLGPEIGQLLSDKQAEKEVDTTIETALRGVALLAYNPFTENNWKSRVMVAERSLNPIIERTIPVLQDRLQPGKLDGHHITSDLEKYKNFLCRSTIKERLQSEREMLLSRISKMLTTKESDIDDKLNGSQMQTGKFLTEVAAKIVWIRQQTSQLENLKALCSGLLVDLPGYEGLASKMTSFLEKLAAAEQEHFDQWCRETIQSIDDPTDSIALETKGKIMILEQKKGTLFVNYSDRLLKLLKEVRQLASLGLSIPSKIVNCANQGEKFYRYGVTVKQIAHFYNTIDTQMLPCQQALMLEEAMAFEKLVISKKNEDSDIGRVTWDEPAQLEQFIAKLQAAGEKLAGHNRRLRNVHSDIVQSVIQLSSMDVLKDVDKWKEILTNIRSKIFEEELAHGASKANMRPWVMHWDRQLYKALQLQYQWGLESLHTQISPIHTQLVFVQQKLQLRPPLEEIRMKYYKEMRKFLGIPEKFKGVQEVEQNSRFFVGMIERNSSRIPAIYQKAETVLRRVQEVDTQFADWLVLGQVDLEELIAEKFTRAADWENQLKILKNKGREVDALPKEIRVECVLVSTAGAKTAIEELLQRLFDTLTWTLRLSITSQLHGIQQFLTQAIGVLSSRPQSIDEVAEANQKHTEFGRTNKELKASWSVLEEQHTLLRSTAGSGVDQMTSLQQQWEKFEIMLDSHQMMIKEQVEVLRTNVDARVNTLREESEKMRARWDQFKPKSDALQGDRETMLKAIEFIKERRQQHTELLEAKEKLEKECDQFDVPIPEFQVLDELGKEIGEFEDNWVIYEEFNAEMATLADEEWIVFRSKTYLFDEFLQKWVDKLKTGTQTHMGVRLLKDIESFKELSGCLKYCRGEVLSTDHWLEMFRMLHMPKGTTIEKLRFGDLISVSSNIISNVDQLKALNARAQGEVTIREAILELEMWAAQSEFNLTDYKHSNGNQMKVIKDWKESINSVKDSQALLQSLKNSPFYTQFADKTGIWETRLSDLDIFLSQMNEIQRKWIYLEPIFGRGALPSESGRFARVDAEYRGILSEVVRDPRLVSLCSRQPLKRSLENLVDQLARCQKALNQFLEEKRSAFPRFYFLGDDDLLEILGQSTNPTVIQNHLKKLFQGIDRVVFGSNNESISTMISSAGESVPLEKPVRVVPQVEIWLQQLSDEMRSTLRSLTSAAIRENDVDPSRFPSQVLCLAESVRFCREVEQVLDGSKDLEKLKKTLQEQLRAYTSTEVSDKVLELKLKALILDLIHNIDVIDQLIANKASSTTCWTWQRQLRFYLQKENVVMRQVNSEFEYTYEYQGNTPKLVHTPLTDKCYLTLTQAMFMGLGGNPYGPAGTGKTESVKALASLFGRQVLVFNCDEGIDLHSMSRIFVGIVQCGAWGCFDEFNRLDQTVLSAVSMQIQTIQDAIKSRSGQCTLGSKNVQVNPNSAIFITLNPAGKGYGGRQKMPDNLKQLFRPVVMSVPDNEIIAETILYSEGFTKASILARKVVAVFKLSKEMLSTQQHYDWGLRALKTVLRGCGQMRAADTQKKEEDIVVQALLLNTLSKLTFSDSKRFNVLIDDIFSEVSKEMATFGDLIEPLAAAAKEMRIELTDKQLQKVFQLYEQLRQRTGVVIVGPPGSGKSTIWRVLQKALVAVENNLNVISFNPKALNRTKLLGNLDMDTREWSDGILTMAARNVIKDTSVHTWIVCDGDIDPEWIEALNSVLDDNRLLTMPSGERIQFGSNVNFIFETDSLQYASPATVSRMGMIFISQEDLSPAEVLQQWLARRNEDEHNDMSSWMERHFMRCFSWIEKEGFAVAGVTPTAAVQNGLTHLAGSSSEKEFLVGLYRGLAPLIATDKKKGFATDVVFQGTSLPDAENPDSVYFDDRTDSLMSFSDDVTNSVTVEDLQREGGRPYILTATAQATAAVVSSWLRPENRAAFVVIGPDGCGKEELLRHCFDRDSNSQLAVVHCSAQSNASAILQSLQQHCVQASSASGRVLRPKEKPNLLLYLKSLNLPAPDKYGTNEMLAFLHQLLTYHGYYDENLEWIGIENVQFVASLSPSGGRPDISDRLLSLIRVCSLDYPTQHNLRTIYSAYLMPILEPSLQSAGRVESMTSSMVEMYEEVKKNYRSTDRNHYIFTPRDLTKWTLSLMRHDLGDIEKVNAAVAYEAERIFRDRLVTDDDCVKFDEMLVNILSFARGRSTETLYVTNATVIPSSNTAGIPLLPTSRKDYKTLLQKSVNRFEFDVANFSQVLTDELCDLCSKVDRALTSPGGSLLLAGRSGVGRRDVVRLIANMHQMQLFTPKITPNYTKKHFDNELRNVLTSSITSGEHVVFVLEDYQLLETSFLQSVNSLLSSGEIPALFTQQELDGLIATARDQASQDGYQGHLQHYLAHRVRSLVHVVLILDTADVDFDTNTAANPSIFKQCNLVWKEQWEKNSLLQMPSLILQKQNIDVSDDTTNAFGEINAALPSNLLSPLKYRMLIENYAKIYTEKKETVAVRLDRLKAGISKLTEAKDEVAKLQKKAAKKSKLLAEKQAEADEALKAITKSMTGAEDQKVSMEQLRTATEKENEKIEKQKIVIDEQLKDVEPLLREAREAVGSIKSDALSEIRSLRAPPEAVRDILQAVLLFMGILDTSWEAMRKFLSKSGVKDDIINFDAHRITKDVHKKVSALVKSKEGSFDPKNAKRASAAAAPLAAWVMANLQYSTILEKISPLEQEKNDLLKNLSKAEKQMDKLSKGLLSVDEKVAELKTKFEVLMKEATQIKIDVEKEQATLQVAGTLVERLSGEFERWQTQMSTLARELEQVERCSLISSALVTFLGGCSERIRNDVMKKLRLLFNMEQFDPVIFCAMETEQLNWKNHGLPSDSLSVENAVVMFTGGQTPLIIDPTGRVAEFLHKFIDKSELLKAAQNDLITQIEFGLRFGKTIIVDDVTFIDRTLIPILRKDLSSQGPRMVISFGDKQIDYHPDFRLFLCTKNEHIVIMSGVRDLVSDINFTTTKSGLTSQLLGAAIRIEKPELEQRSSDLARDSEEKKMELDKLEQLLLQQLATSEGNLLENTVLLDSLNKSKENAMTISKSIEEGELLRQQLQQERNAYLSLSEFASSLYFVFSDLHRHNQMYNFNVNTITYLFKKTIQECKDTSEKRVETLIRSLQLSVFHYISRALFKSDRLMFALSFIHGTLPKMFQPNEWELFSGVLVTDVKETNYTNKNIAWIDESRQAAVNKLQSTLPSLFNTLQLEDQGTWNEFGRSVDCENSVPTVIDKKITPFQKVLLIQAARPERLYAAMQQFVLATLAIPSINPPTTELSDILVESRAEEPILLIISGGADPSQELEQLALKTQGAEKWQSISMGQGQDTVAVSAIRKAMQEGGWVCLNNVHLMLSIVPLIQKELGLSTPNESFRLWLTTEAEDRFPAIMLQNTLKVTFEPPPGVRNNLLRTYAQIEPSQRSTVTCQAIFVLAWLHALLQERRTYIPQAWTKFYEFSTADVRVARLLIEQLTSDGRADWEFVRGLLQYVIYGGRIENTFDNFVLESYLNTLFNDHKITGKEGQSVTGNIQIIAQQRVEAYTDYITNSVPREDEAGLFGLPANISFSWQLTEAEETLARMRTIASAPTFSTDRSQWGEISQPILQLWKKLCSGSDLHSRQIPHPKESSDPIIEILSIENIHSIQVVQHVHHVLARVSRCVRGVDTADAMVTQTIQSLRMHQTPSSWESAWNGPLDPVDYLNSLIYKAKSTEELLRDAERGGILEKPLNLSKMLRPATLLNALRQMTARKKSCTMDSLRLSSAWISSKLSGEVGMTIKGVLLQGAQFDGNLKDTTSSSPPVIAAPPLTLAWTSVDSAPIYAASESISVPLYDDVSRESLVATVSMPCSDVTKWTIASVALFLR